MVGVFEDVATDPRFLRIAAVNADEMAVAVRSASIRYSNPLQGGFAGRIVSESGDDLGLVSKLLFHGLGEYARIREITQRHGGQCNGSLVADG